MDDSKSSRSGSLNNYKEGDDFSASHNYLVPTHLKYPPVGSPVNSYGGKKEVRIITENSDHVFNRSGDRLQEEGGAGKAAMETSYGRDDETYTRAGIPENEKDLVHYLAEEKAKDRRAVTRRRVLWQTCTFMIAFLINVLVTFREQFVIDKTEIAPDSDLRFATNLSKGIGFIIIGNLYDNVARPKRLTFVILLCLALATGLGAIPP
jgi:hypothetical protein